jgi:hypothetical protein
MALAEKTARIALVGVAGTDEQLLADSFRQFKLTTTSVSMDHAVTRLTREKFEGCVIPLAHARAEEVLKAVRSAPSNKHMVLYGISDQKTAMRFSSFGLNAILHSPLEKQTLLRMVRGTYLLALHEFRRYVRVPVAIAVTIDDSGSTIYGLTQEVSSGGMSFNCTPPPGSKPVQAAFTLPGAKTVSIKGTICWRREKDSFFGLRFDFADPNRQVVRNWIEDFLDSNAEAAAAAKAGA